MAFGAPSEHRLFSRDGESFTQYVILFEEKASKNEKDQYAGRLGEAISKENMEAVLLDGDILCLAARLALDEVQRWKTSIVSGCCRIIFLFISISVSHELTRYIYIL